MAKYVNFDPGDPSTVVFPERIPVFESAEAILRFYVRGGLVYDNVLERACTELEIELDDADILRERFFVDFDVLCDDLLSPYEWWEKMLEIRKDWRQFHNEKGDG